MKILNALIADKLQNGKRKEFCRTPCIITVTLAKYASKSAKNHEFYGQLKQFDVLKNLSSSKLKSLDLKNFWWT